MKGHAADDPWHATSNHRPGGALIEKGALGQKTRAGSSASWQGIRYSTWRSWTTVPLPGDCHRRSTPFSRSGIRHEKFAALRASGHRSQILWAIFRDIFPLAACQLEQIADTPATSTSPCAGASAGARVRSRHGRPRAGSRSPKRLPRHRRRRRHECTPCQLGVRGNGVH